MPEKGLSAGEPGEPGEECLGLELGSMLGPGDLESPLAAGSATPGLSPVPFSPPARPSVVTVMLLCANEALLVSFTETLQLLGTGARCARLSGTEGEGETGNERSPRNSWREVSAAEGGRAGTELPRGGAASCPREPHRLCRPPGDQAWPWTVRRGSQ